MGVAVFGRLRPYHLTTLAIGQSGEPVRSVTRYAAEFAEPRGEMRNNMARKNTTNGNGNGHTVTEDIASIEREIGQLMHDIEARVGRLNALARRSAKDAASDASEFVSDTI